MRFSLNRPEFLVLSMESSHTCTGSSTPQGPRTARESAAHGIAFRRFRARRHPRQAQFRGSIAGLRAPRIQRFAAPSRVANAWSGPSRFGRDRNQARAPRGEHPNWPRFLKPLYDPGRSDFPSPVLASALTVFVRTSLPPRRETAVLAHPSPRHRGVCITPSPRRRPRRPQLRVWLRAHHHGRRVPRAPLPSAGVTRAGAASQAAWKGITPSSSLIRAHAPDHPPPSASGSPSAAGSLQVVTSPCCEMALPDIISAILAQVLGPLPRRAPRLRVSASSPRTPVSPQSRRVRRANIPPHGSFRGDIDFEAAVIRSPSSSRAC